MCCSVLSNGTGRTGAFIGLSVAIEHVRTENMVDVYGTVKNLRTQRPHMIQTLVSSSLPLLPLVPITHAQCTHTHKHTHTHTHTRTHTHKHTSTHTHTHTQAHTHTHTHTHTHRHTHAHTHRHTHTQVPLTCAKFPLNRSNTYSATLLLWSM